MGIKAEPCGEFEYHALNVLPLTKHITKKFNPMHIRINRDDVKGYLANDSLILVEQITTVDRRTVMGKLGRVSGQSEVMQFVKEALQNRLYLDGREERK